MEEERMMVPDRPTPGTCSDWHAWYDHGRPGPATLIVTGRCEVPRTDYNVELRRAEQQGTNPKDLLLERTVVTGSADGWAVGEPSGRIEGEEPWVPTREARYKETTGFKYETVTILPDDVTVPVDDVH
jgi:hypothetical protein